MSDIDYASVLEDLHRRRDELEKAIAAVGRILGQEPTAASPTDGGAPRRDPPVEIRGDTFFNMTVREAAIQLLKMRKKPLTAREISDSLKKGGMVSAADDFYQTVYTGLRRARKSGVLVQHPKTKEWGLSDWYPTRPTNTSAKTERADESSEGEDSDDETSTEETGD